MIIIHNHTPVERDSFSEDILHTGLSLYEVFRVFRGDVIFMEDNLSRLAHSIRKSRLDINITDLNIPEKLEQMIRLEGLTEGNIKYVLHIVDKTVNEYIYQIHFYYPTEEEYRLGVDVITLRAERENAEVKYINHALREKTNQLIHAHRVYEILLINNEQYITEGSRSNVFFIRENTLYTTPLPYVLPGTTRKRVLEICNRETIPVIETAIPYRELSRYESAFLTGTSPLILPIRTIDHARLDPGHPLLRRVMECYFSLLSRNSAGI